VKTRTVAGRSGNGGCTHATVRIFTDPAQHSAIARQPAYTTLARSILRNPARHAEPPAYPGHASPTRPAPAARTARDGLGMVPVDTAAFSGTRDTMGGTPSRTDI
jgi:hypothetical protein